MPWGEKDAKRKTKRASTPAKKKRWAKVANKALRSGKGDASAIKIANAVVKRKKKRKPRKR